MEVLFLVLGAVATGVGAYLRHDGHPGHDLAGLVTAGLGGVELVVLGAAGARRNAEAGVDCSVFGRCEGVDSLWGDFAGPMLGDILRNAAAGAVAYGIGWAVAKATRRPSG